MNYYVRLDDDDNPILLYRATPDMEEQVWSDKRGWLTAEFMIDVMDGFGNIYFIKEDRAKELFPTEAFY